jgi:hypothetical protein
MKRDKVIEVLDQLPIEFDIEDLVEKLIFIQKVEIGLIQAKEGKTIPLNRAKELFLNRWEKQK